MKKQYTLKELLEARKEAVACGAVYELQDINYLIAKLVKKMKVDYYTL